jgi:hypothetical protein
MDPSVYPDPLRFRPARYLGKADAKQETQGYAGWGSGLHPCRKYPRLYYYRYQHCGMLTSHSWHEGCKT